MTAVPLAHADRAHALLSASNSERWTICMPSARLEAQFPDKGSEYAREGSLAHEIAELKLRKQFTDPMGPKAFKSRLKHLQEHELYHPDMEAHTDAYADFIKGITLGHKSAPYIALEQRLDYSAYAPEGFGTGDCLIIGGNTLDIVDFKYGKGHLVLAENNTQMALYALASWLRYSMLYDIKVVRMSIFQPRLDNISSWEISLEELLSIGEWIKPRAQMAYNGEGEFVAGEHCMFCRARYQCRARSAQLSSVADDFPQTDKGTPVLPPLMSDEEVGRVLARAQQIAKWAKDLEDYALNSIMNGTEIPGWKVVEGRRVRAFTDTDAAFEKLKSNGYDEALLWERKPISLTKVEALVKGKKAFTELLSDFITIAPGKPTLAPVSDKREPLARASIKADFGGTEE